MKTTVKENLLDKAIDFCVWVANNRKPFFVGLTVGVLGTLVGITVVDYFAAVPK